jgi:DNA-binding transcriptional LysR family regulator
MDKAEKAMEEVSESRKGSLCLGASTIPGQYIIPPLLKKFKDKFPNISISLDIGDTEKIFTKVVERELDIGIVGGWFNNRKIEGFKWLEDKLVIIVPNNHKLALKQEVEVEDLMTEKWIFREKGSGTQKAVEELLLAHGIKKDDLNVYIEAGSTEAAVAAVESGMGISIVSDWAIMKIDPSRKIKALKINSPNAQRFLYVIYPRQKTRRKSVNNFMEFLKNYKDIKNLVL